MFSRTALQLRIALQLQIARTSQFTGILVCCLLGAAPLGCGKTAGAPAVAAASPAVDSPEPPRPELTVDEQRLMERLKTHVDKLTGLGERSPDRIWEHADAADYIAEQFERLGYPVERQGYEVDGVAVMNIAVTASGGERGDQVIVVGAHYDTPPAASGQAGSATSVAALIELARLMRDARLVRTIRFVAFALGEAPHGVGEARGSRLYARELKRVDDEARARLDRQNAAREAGEVPAGLPPEPVSRISVVGMMHLDDLGDFSAPSPKSSGEGGAVAPRPSRMVVSLDACPEATAWLEPVLENLQDEPVEVRRSALPALSEAPQPDTDAGAFAEIQVPAISIHGRGGSVDPDLDGAARVVMRIRAALSELGGEKFDDSLLVR